MRHSINHMPDPYELTRQNLWIHVHQIKMRIYLTFDFQLLVLSVHNHQPTNLHCSTKLSHTSLSSANEFAERLQIGGPVLHSVSIFQHHNHGQNSLRILSISSRGWPRNIQGLIIPYAAQSSWILIEAYFFEVFPTQRIVCPRYRWTTSSRPVNVEQSRNHWTLSGLVQIHAETLRVGRQRWGPGASLSDPAATLILIANRANRSWKRYAPFIFMPRPVKFNVFKIYSNALCGVPCLTKRCIWIGWRTFWQCNI